MQTEEGQAIFRRRKLIERIHAHYKHRGLGRLNVRGLIKSQAVALWHALANNLMIAHPAAHRDSPPLKTNRLGRPPSLPPNPGILHASAQ